MAKMLYAATMTEQSPSIQSLAAKLGIGRWAVTRHCKELEQAGWMKITEEGRFRRPAAIVPADVEAKVAQEVRELIELSPFLGEATFKGFAVWILHPAVKLAFNVRPPFLRNKSTGQNLECDVAALEHAWVGEYQGPQHFGPTELFKGEKEFIERYKRDQLKAELCKKHAIRLSCVTKNDLTLQRVLDVLPADIPRRVIDPAGPFVKMLESLGRKVAEGKDWDRD
ncbi:MAG TPA: hypothetical protein GXX23_11300 [Firmicutes bacterium]|nr:hypothetical protein [Candidatus Fermentithermobacillaceae bacterium]